MNREKVLDIAIKQAANPTNWGLNFFFLGPSPGVARALKTSWTDPDKGWRGKHRQGGELAVRKKSIGVPASSFRLSRAVDFRADKKKRNDHRYG